jgi:hypothetical protein
VLFDGTRLGLEATMITALCVAIPAGLQSGLSANLGYLVRYSEGLVVGGKAFSFGSFIFSSLAGMLVLCMMMFFGIAIPTMLYTMGLVTFSLQWLRKRRGRDRLANVIVGAILALLFGTPCTVIVLLLIDMRPNGSLYVELLRWPNILSIDGIVLLWSTLTPLINIIGGIRSGLKVAEIIENVKMYWYF